MERGEDNGDGGHQQSRWTPPQPKLTATPSPQLPQDVLLSNSAFFDICCFSCVILPQSSSQDVLNCKFFYNNLVKDSVVLTDWSEDWAADEWSGSVSVLNSHIAFGVLQCMLLPFYCSLVNGCFVENCVYKLNTFRSFFAV